MRREGEGKVFRETKPSPSHFVGPSLSLRSRERVYNTRTGAEKT